MPKRFVYAMVLVFLISLGIGVGNVAYTNHVADQRVKDQLRAERTAAEAARAASCELIVAFDDLYREQPPESLTPAGRRVAAVWAKYRLLC